MKLSLRGVTLDIWDHTVLPATWVLSRHLFFGGGALLSQTAQIPQEVSARPIVASKNPVIAEIKRAAVTHVYRPNI